MNECAICGQPLKHPKPYAMTRAVHPECYERETGGDFRREGLLSQAARWHVKSNAARMKLALIAARIVGRYEVGATIELANRLHMSVSQVQNYARAGRLFAEMVEAARNEDRDPDYDEETGEMTHTGRGLSDQRAALYESIRRFRDDLGITYWYTLDRLREKYNGEGHFTIALVWSYMAEVLEHDGTIDRLVTLVNNEHGAAPASPGNEAITDPGFEMPREDDGDGPIREAAQPPARPTFHTYRGRVIIVDRGNSGNGQITIEIESSDEIKIGSEVQITVADPVVLPAEMESDQ